MTKGQGKLAAEARRRGVSEDELIEALLKETESINGAARRLDMSDAGFRRHMRKLGIVFSRNIVITITRQRKE